MLTIIENGSKAWAVAATNGDLRIYSREQAGAWSELPLSEESEQIDEDGSVILEALYERETGQSQDKEREEPEAEEEPDVDEEEEPEEEEPDDEEEEEPEAEEEEPQEEKPRRSRGRTKAKK
jgi:cobalamin biosynthesis protein CobT